MSVRFCLDEVGRDDQTALVKDLHVTEPKSFWSYGDETYRDVFYISKDRQLYLPFHYVMNMLKDGNPNKSIVYKKVKPYEFLYKLRDYQEEVFNLTFKSLMRTGTCIINVYCSFGKTIVAVYVSCFFAKKYGLSVMILLPAINSFVTLWLKAFTKSTNGCKVHAFGISKGEPEEDTHVYISTKNSIAKIDSKILGRIGVLIMDEAHLLCSQISIKNILRMTPYFIMALTATWERDDHMHKAMELICGSEKIVRISTKRFFVFKISTQFVPKGYKVGPRGKIWTSVQEKYDEMDERNNGIIDYVISNNRTNSIVLTLRYNHSVELVGMLKEEKQDVFLYAGKVKKYKDTIITVGTMKKMGVGFDEENVCEDWKGVRKGLLFQVASTKKPEQYFGRVFRCDIPAVFFFVDNFRNNKDHWTECKKWIEERNGIIINKKFGDKIVWEDIKEDLIEEYGI